MKAKPFTITDVGALLGIQKLPGGGTDSYQVVCPYCKDQRGKCSFHVIKGGKIANVYHCFHCGAGGNMLTLYADLNGIQGADRYREAYWRIQEELPFGYQEGRMRQRNVLQQEKKSREHLPRPADQKRRDAAYREMVKLLKLSDRHRRNLHKRGLTEAEISKMVDMGYRSTCAEESVSIARRLLKRGYRLEGVPGFFVNRSGDWEIAFYKKNSGLLCPVWSEEGLLEAFQIRLDVPYEKRKYVWLSSARLDKGCSPGSPVGLSGSRDIRKVYVTEGILKAEIAHQRTGKTYIGNPGVLNYKELEHLLGSLKERGLKEVVEAYDMDKFMRVECRRDYGIDCRKCTCDGPECQKKQEKRDKIRSGCVKLYEICRKLSLACSRAAWDLDADGMWQGNYKGIDDWELSGCPQEYGRKAA